MYSTLRDWLMCEGSLVRSFVTWPKLNASLVRREQPSSIPSYSNFSFKEHRFQLSHCMYFLIRIKSQRRGRSSSQGVDPREDCHLIFLAPQSVVLATNLRPRISKAGRTPTTAYHHFKLSRISSDGIQPSLHHPMGEPGIWISISMKTRAACLRHTL